MSSQASSTRPQEHLDIIFLNATTSNHTTLQARSKRFSEDAVRLMEQHVASDNEGQVVEGNYYFPPHRVQSTRAPPSKRDAYDAYPLERGGELL